jgi:hypothetical protein
LAQHQHIHQAQLLGGQACGGGDVSGLGSGGCSAACACASVCAWPVRARAPAHVRLAFMTLELRCPRARTFKGGGRHQRFFVVEGAPHHPGLHKATRQGGDLCCVSWRVSLAGQLRARGVHIKARAGFVSHSTRNETTNLNFSLRGNTPLPSTSPACPKHTSTLRRPPTHLWRSWSGRSPRPRTQWFGA